MSDLASRQSGALVVAASSYDQAHPPSCIIDGEPRTFWLTTGSFPQVAILQLAQPCLLKSVEIIATGIRKLELAKCEGSQAVSWETILETEVDDSEGVLQRIPLHVPSRVTASFIRIKVIIIYFYLFLLFYF